MHRDRQTDRQTDRLKQTDRQTELIACYLTRERERESAETVRTETDRVNCLLLNDTQLQNRIRSQNIRLDHR